MQLNRGRAPLGHWVAVARLKERGSSCCTELSRSKERRIIKKKKLQGNKKTCFVQPPDVTVWWRLSSSADSWALPSMKRKKKKNTKMKGFFIKSEKSLADLGAWYCWWIQRTGRYVYSLTQERFMSWIQPTCWKPHGHSFPGCCCRKLRTSLPRW